MTTKFSLGAQIEEVEYELKMRHDVYERRVAAHKMKQSLADLHIARMESVLATLRWLQQYEQDVRDYVAKARASDHAPEPEKAEDVS
jgi:hypothetical protein